MLYRSLNVFLQQLDAEWNRYVERGKQQHSQFLTANRELSHFLCQFSFSLISFNPPHPYFDTLGVVKTDAEMEEKARHPTCNLFLVHIQTMN